MVRSLSRRPQPAGCGDSGTRPRAEAPLAGVALVALTIAASASMPASPALAASITYTDGQNNALPIILNSAGTQFEVDGTDAAEQSGSISQTGGSWGIEKTGTGTLTLSGSNSYTGGTTLEAGVLAKGSSGALPNGAFTIDGGVLDLGQPGVSVQNMTSLSGTGGAVDFGSQVVILSINQSGTTTFDGDFTGTAGLIQKLGTGSLTLNGSVGGVGTGIAVQGGTLVLNGANTYGGGSGSTLIGNGILEVGNDAALSTSFVSVNDANSELRSNTDVTLANRFRISRTNNANLTLSGDHDMTLNGIIDEIGTGGGGQLLKSGAGTVVLGGINTYSGGTTISGGTISVATDANLGAASGGVTLAGGTLAATASFDTARSFTLTTGGFIETDGSVALGLTGAISGSGGLTKLGAGTLTLAGSNSYAGGTSVMGGTLSLRQDDAAGTGAIKPTSAVIDYADGIDVANPVAMGSDAIRFQVLGGMATQSGMISEIGGAYGIDKTGGGVLVLNGTETFTGGTEVSAGTLALGAGGSIATSGVLDLSAAGTDFDISQTSGAAVADLSGVAGSHVDLGGQRLTITSGGSIYDGVIEDGGIAGGSGGSFSKAGAGTLTLNGQNTYTGATTVAAGKLVVGDDSHAGASLASVVTVVSGASLGGIGTIGGLVAHGTVAPGNSIGTLTVAGDAEFATGSSYDVEVDPASGASDLIHATGQAHLNGGSVAHIGLVGTYEPVSTYTILTADGGIDGSFGVVTSDFAFLYPSLSYDADNVYLELVRNDLNFGDKAATPNQAAAAQGVQSLGAGSPLYRVIAALPDNDSLIQSSFDQLSGEVHASLKSALIGGAGTTREAVGERLAAAFAAGAGDSSPSAGPVGDGPVLWEHPYGGWSHADTDGNAAPMIRGAGGILFGADREVTPGWRLGLLGGYGHETMRLDDRRSFAQAGDYTVGLYSGGQLGAVQLSGGATLARHRIHTARSVAFGGFSDALTADYGAATAQIFGEAGYRLATPGMALVPFVGLAHVALVTDGTTESGGAAALAIDGATTHITFANLGVHAGARLPLSGVVAELKGTVGWRHVLGGATPTSTAHFAGGDSFTVAGNPIAQDAAVLSAGLGVAFSDRADLDVSYSGQLSGHASDHAVHATLSVHF